MKKSRIITVLAMVALMTALVFILSACQNCIPKTINLALPMISTTAKIPDAKDMVPTEADIDNMSWNGSYLFLTIDGENYRYKHSYDDPSELTMKRLLKAFVHKNRSYSVYATVEYPELQVLIVKSNDETMLYKYEPPHGCASDALEKAIADGYVGTADSEFFGLEKWEGFYEKYKKGEPCEIKIFHYYGERDPDKIAYDGYECTKEDYPRIFYGMLKYDGEKLIYTLDDGTDVTLKYLKTERRFHPANEYRDTIDQTVYYLVDDLSVTYTQIITAYTSSVISQSNGFRSRLIFTFNNN